MPADLRAELKRVAPGPAGPLDIAVVARKARRARGMRFASAALLVAGAVVSVTLVPSLVSSERFAPRTEDGYVDIPDGPRHEVLSGTFPSNWAEPYAGRDWRLLAWSEGDVWCWQVKWQENAPDNAGLSCTDGDPHEMKEDFLGSFAFLTKSPDESEGWFSLGVVGPRVESVTFVTDRGPTAGVPYEVQVQPGPPGGVDLSYFLAVVPAFDYGEMRAVGRDGEALETHHLCGPGCERDREAENDARVAAYEAEPITEMSRAATFVNVAVGRAGLIDEFETLYVYEGIEERGDTFIARYDVMACEPPEPEKHSCGRKAGRAELVVAPTEDGFRIVDASGPMSDREREALLSFRSQVPSDGRWLHVATSLAPAGSRGEWWYSIAMVWSGNLPAPTGDYGSMCRVRVYDSEGELVFDSREGRDIEFLVGSNASSRVSRPITGLEGVEDPARFDVDCDEPHDDLWESTREP